MTPRELLARLQALDIHVGVEDGNLRVNAPEGALTSELRAELVRIKPEVMAFLAASRVWSSPHPAIVPLRPQGSSLPFFGVPGHNGDVFCFVHLARRLGEDQPFYALQPPGLDGRNEPLDDALSLGRLYADQLSSFRPDGPFLIGGYCMGGTIAFETARQLAARGRTVALLVLFGSPFPASLQQSEGMLARAREVAAGRVRQLRELGRRPSSEWMRYLTERRERRPVRPRIPMDDVVRRRIEVERATLAAVRRYPLHRHPGRVALLLPSDEWGRSADRPLEWRTLAAGGFETFTGAPDNNGDVMLREPHVAWAAERLQELLDRAAAGAAARTA